MTQAVTEAYDAGVLSQGTHGRLVQDLDQFARDAGIEPRWVLRPLSATVTAEELAWVKRFRFHREERTSGLVLTEKGVGGSHVEDHVSAIAGALTRNFIRAQVLTLNQVIESVKSDVFPTATCLLVPNFFVGKAKGSTPPAWQVSLLQDVLSTRRVAGMQTVLYVSDTKAMAVEYGTWFSQFLEAHYRKV